LFKQFGQRIEVGRGDGVLNGGLDDHLAEWMKIAGVVERNSRRAFGIADEDETEIFAVSVFFCPDYYVD
jgi:hypothetical protein